MDRIKQKLIKVAVGILILGGLFFVFLTQSNFSKNNTNETFTAESSISLSESSLLPYSDSSFDFNEYLENNTAKTITTTGNVLGYKIELITKEDSHGIVLNTKLSISRNGELFYETNDQKFSPIFSEFTYDNNGHWRFLETAEDFISFALSDITANGTPELVFNGWSGGAHCCQTIHILELGEELSVFWDFDTEDSGVSIIDINKDGIMELITGDAIFNYWKTSYSTSPKPDVILSFNGSTNKYVVNTNMMHKPAPIQEVIESKAKIWSKDGWNDYGSDGCAIWPNMDCTVPWAYAIDLLYSGNLESAKTYIDLVWRDNEQFKSKDIFWNELKEQIKKSNFYADISPNLIDLTKLP